ncbi:MAG: Amidohydrolase [Thermotoga sp. 50_1627]|nr:MAG: Amidohydrolase [Thermotoga sp. 50_64]KUK24711.1 MAG: Amidohydrolase [Thermotoga sp. 50_1627]MDK2923276.1 dihydroorotase [Pseudothermotoga sp.]
MNVELNLPEQKEGLVACPTFFDMHTHVRLNGQEDYDSLEKAAIAGGFGAVLIQPNTNPELDNVDVLDAHLRLAQNKVVDFYWSVSLFGELEPDGKRTLCYSNDGIEYDTIKILNAFKRKRPHLVLDHSQMHELGGFFYEATPIDAPKRPICSEAVSIFRNVMFGLECGFKKFHIQHVSTKLSIETIEYLRKYAKVSCEVTPHHLFFNMNDVKNTNFKINPPLGTEHDRKALLEAVERDVIGVFATDHAPHAEKPDNFEKAPFGTSGIEIAFSAFYTATNRLEKTIEKLTVAPRKVLGIEGAFDPDNVTVIDPNFEWTVDTKKFHSKGKNCVFDGTKLKGRVVGVKRSGRWVYWDGEFFLDET